jgi:endonuclease/exonuclease/phosphatase family metal-dependent hydrolase
MQLAPSVPPCRVQSADTPVVRWIAPDAAVERRLLMSWCETVGPVGAYRRGAPANPGATLVVSWNVHAGAGDVPALLASLRAHERRAGREDPNVILLLQEAIRIGAAPAQLPEGSPVPRRIASSRAPLADILDVAAREDLNALYVPSMRNGREGSNGREGPSEDRGNAILSTLPISDAVAIELPFAAQRRVAVSALVQTGTSTLRVVSAHLDTSGGQGRQAAALLDGLSAAGVSGPMLVAADFNSSMRRRAFIRSSGLTIHRADCRGATHKVFQLDHILTNGTGLVSDCERLDRFGSDHAPLKVTLSSPHPAGGGGPFPSTVPALQPSRR